MIQTKNLIKKYDDKTVLDLPALTIESGRQFGLAGNNGAGKTTFFSLILDIIEATGGMVLSDNKDVKRSSHWQMYTGAYIDERFLINHLTADEYFDFVRKSYNMDTQAFSEFPDRFSDFFNGEILGKSKYIRDFSRGNQKKIGIAAAMMSHPKVLVLDEPFPHLDPTSVNRLKQFLDALKDDPDVTVLISSHDLNHVTDVCDRIAILENGNIVHDLKTGENTLQELNAYFKVD